MRPESIRQSRVPSTALWASPIRTCVRLALATLCLTLAPGCSNPFSHSSPEPFLGGFALTFDDFFVDEWYAQRDLFDEYGVRATFFVTRFAKLTAARLDMLGELERSGHEIGSHALSHISALTYLQDHTAEEYVADQVMTSVALMGARGFHVRSFAFPYGDNNEALDAEVLRHGLAIRDVTEAQRQARTVRVVDIAEVFYRPGAGPIVCGLGIDRVFAIPLAEIEEAFGRARDSTEVIVLYAHRPVDRATGSYEVERQYLDSVFRLAQTRQLESLTISQVVTLD